MVIRLRVRPRAAVAVPEAVVVVAVAVVPAAEEAVVVVAAASRWIQPRLAARSRHLRPSSCQSVVRTTRPGVIIENDPGIN